LPQATANQARRTLQGSPTVATPTRRSRLMIAAGLGLAVLVILAILILSRSAGSAPQNSTLAPALGVVQVTPVATDENMVLVAQPEQVGKQPRDVTRFIVQNLTDTLDTGIPFSKLRIREYPTVITTADQARAAAKANHAWVIVWGSADDDAIDLQ